MACRSCSGIGQASMVGDPMDTLSHLPFGAGTFRVVAQDGSYVRRPSIEEALSVRNGVEGRMIWQDDPDVAEADLLARGAPNAG